MPILIIFSHKVKFSEIENRYMATFPEFSVENVLDRSYMKGIESYLSDNFIARPDWISMKTNAEIASGKKEQKGVFILNDRLLEKFNPPDFKTVDKSINAISAFSTKIKKPVFVMIAPTSAGIYTDKLPQNAPVYNEKAFIDYIYKNLGNTVTSLDVYSPLNSTREEYIYYRTDHHWTTLGAYYAYASSIKKLGFAPISLNSFDIENASNDFRGTLYSKVIYDKIKPDTLDFYHYNGGTKVLSVEVETGMQKKTYDSMYFKDFVDKKDKYASFLGTNQPVVTIKTDAPDNKKILVIKDSYAHCFVPFLAQHYSEIKMVDLRYTTQSLDKIVNLNDYNQVLFLYNASTFASDDNLQKLNFVK